MYFNYNYVYVYVYVPIIVMCVKVFGQINSHRMRSVRYPTKLMNSPTYNQPNYHFDAYNQYVRPKQVFSETPPLRSSPYLVHDHNHNLIDDQYYNVRDSQAFQRRKNPYFGVNHVKTNQHLPKQRNAQHFNYNAGQRPQSKPSKEQYHKKREEIHHFHTHSAIIDEGGPQSVQKKKNLDNTNPDIFYFKAHLKNNKNPQKSEHQNQSKNQLLQNGSMDKYRDRSQVYNAYNNQRAAKNQQNVKPNYNQNGHWNKDLYISKSDVHQNNQKLEKPSIRDPNKNRQILNVNTGSNRNYNHQKNSGYQYKKDVKLPTSINDMLNQIPRKHSHNANTHPSPRVEYNENIVNINKKNSGIHSHPNSDVQNKLKHNTNQKQKFSHQSKLIFKQNQQEFPLEKSDATKKKKESNNVRKTKPSKQQKSTNSEHIKRSKEPYKKTVALIREFTAIMPSDDDDDFSSLTLVDDTPLPELTTKSSAKKTNKKQKQTKVEKHDFYDDYEAPPKLDTEHEDVVKPVTEAEEQEEDLSDKTKQNTQHSDHDEYQKKSEELRRLMQEDLSNKLYDDDDEEELSKPVNKKKKQNQLKTVQNKINNKKANNNFEKEVDISADDLERYFDKEFSSFHSDKVDNSDIKPEVEEIEVSVQPLKPEQTEEVYDEEGDDHQFKGKNFKSEYESEPSEQKPENKKTVEVSQKADHLENESEPEYKTSSDFLRSHDDFLNRIDKENDKFRKDTEEKVRNSGKDEKDEEDSDTNGETNAKNENEDESEEESDKKEEEEAEPAEDDNKNNKENNEESDDSASNSDDSKEKAKNESEEEETEDEKEDSSDKDNENEENSDKTEEKAEKNDENERNEANDQKLENNAIKQNDEINEEYNVNEHNNNNNNNNKCLDGSKCNGDNLDNTPKQLNANEFEMKINDNSNDNNIINNNEMQNINMIPLSVVNTETETESPLNHNHQSYQTSLNPIPMPISMPYSDNEMLDQTKHLDDTHPTPELAMNPLPYYVDLQRINFNNGNILNAQKHNFVSDIGNQRVIYDNMQK